MNSSTFEKKLNVWLVQEQLQHEIYIQKQLDQSLKALRDQWSSLNENTQPPTAPFAFARGQVASGEGCISRSENKELVNKTKQKKKCCIL